MKYIFIFLIIVFVIVLWSNWYEKKLLKNLRKQLIDQWGNIPEEEYTSEKFEAIKAFYLSKQDHRFDVDDITWNDLDMDDIFMLINNTQSSIGEEYLYALLRKPCFSKEELEERNRLIHFFGQNQEQRLSLQIALKKLGKPNNISIYKYINRLDQQTPTSNWPHYIMALGLLISVAFLFIEPSIGGTGTLIFFANNIYQYYKRKAQIDKYLIVFAYILRLLDSVNEIEELRIPEIKKYTDILKQDATTFKSFKSGAFLLTPKNASGNLLDAIVDYSRMLFHLDLIKYNSMLNLFKKKREILNRLFIYIGFLDSMISAASFRELLDYYSEPELVKARKPFLTVTGLYHPLLENPVSSSIAEDRCVLITGSNASGKSTFIKTLAINAILSETIFTSISKSYSASYFTIYSSMALRDSIQSNESYYIVEIKSLKRILDRINDEIPTLCFIDEVLRGTNTLERIAASSRILASLSKKNALVFAATHDIELTHILENYYSNYHFQERIINNEIIFDYKLFKGRAVSRNAIKLLGMLGYSQEIIAEAENAAEGFLLNGEWEKLR